MYTLRPYEKFRPDGTVTWDEYLVHQPQLYSEFFPDSTLFLSDWHVSRLDEDSWKQFINKLETFIQLNNINTVVVDTTLNPINTNRRPTLAQMQKDLSELCTCHWLTPDFSYWYDPKPGFIFFPYCIWIYATRNIHKYFNQDTVWADPYAKNTEYDTRLEKTKALMCLNRNTQWHRIYLFSLIAQRPWMSKIEYSFLNKIPEKFRSSMVVNQYLNDEDFARIESVQDLLPIYLEEESTVEAHLIPTQYMRGAGSVGNPVYADCAINFVTETSLTEGCILTEKTAKPFMAYQIPIILGPVGTNKFLQDLGLDMFVDIVPWHTWDHLLDHKQKIDKIVGFMDSILSGSAAEQEILDLHARLQPRLIQNKKYFHSNKFANKCSMQLQNYKYATN
jgi:hypothetical protein